MTRRILPALARLRGPALALAAGALAAVAHPPFSVWPGLAGYPLLLWLLDRLEGPGRLRRAFGYGWLAGFAYFLIGCWWVAEAFMVDAENQAWMAPFAATLLPAGLALFWGAASALWRRIAPPHAGRVLVFAACLGLLEWLRGHVLTGFPWNLPGETWKAGSPPSQAAALVGAYGLTVLTVAAACAFMPVFRPGSRKTRGGMAALGLTIFAILWVGGTARLAGATPGVTPILVRIVQADVPQASKWTEAAFEDIVRRYLNLTSRQAGDDPQVIVWPEGALPASAELILDPQRWVAPAIARALMPGQVLLMGTYREARGADGRLLYYNSLIAVRRRGDGLVAEAVYDKHRLVPFGEYLPLEQWLEPLGVKDLTHIGDGFSPGPRPRPMRIAGLPPMQPLICYEGLFPGLADPGAGRPAWIVNVSNDAWFGPTSGPRQHLNLAAYRAIEQGLPIVRSTPTGVSALVDPWGRIPVGARRDPGESGVIDVRLPAPAAPTPYSRLGDTLFWLLTALGFAFAVTRRRPLPAG